MPATNARSGSEWLGLLLFVGMMAAGYYYNVTFVQLGLTDLGTRALGLSRGQVALDMALFALLTCASALLVGWWMGRRGWGARLRVKLRLAFAVALVQTALTAVAPQLPNEGALLAWIVLASLAMGVGVPASFSLAVDWVRARDRGWAAAAITALAYAAANLAPPDWRVGALRDQVLWLLAGGTLALGVLAFARLPLVARWAEQHKDPAFGRGRYVRGDGARLNRRLVGLIAFMFGIYFIDSLGFLRLVESPDYMLATWQSPEFGPRLTLALAHGGAALAAGVLYTSLGERHLFWWVFGLFALVHLMYTYPVRLLPDAGPTLAEPLLYAVAVSLYTVVNFAVWADVSTPRTIPRNAALGVALSGWTATFVSTALALRWSEGGVPFEQHLRWVDAVAFLFFLSLFALALFENRRAPDGGRS